MNYNKFLVGMFEKCFVVNFDSGYFVFWVWVLIERKMVGKLVFV